uniref:Uncharacterized protein n=1 Tax=Entomoneis paludosa TaxID=265537 RepID=A0A7S3DME8_9STRA
MPVLLLQQRRMVPPSLLRQLLDTSGMPLVACGYPTPISKTDPTPDPNHVGRRQNHHITLCLVDNVPVAMFLGIVERVCIAKIKSPLVDGAFVKVPCRFTTK